MLNLILDKRWKSFLLRVEAENELEYWSEAAVGQSDGGNTLSPSQNSISVSSQE